MELPLLILIPDRIRTIERIIGGEVTSLSGAPILWQWIAQIEICVFGKPDLDVPLIHRVRLIEKRIKYLEEILNCVDGTSSYKTIVENLDNLEHKKFGTSGNKQSSLMERLSALGLP